MKKTLALILAVAMLLVLFAACGDKTPAPGTEATATTAPEKTAAPTPKATAPAEETSSPATEDPGPYNFAAGKYAVDADGFPIEQYEYELPLTTTDETFTFWTAVLTPQFLPEEGYGSMPYPKGFEEYTGVNIEYQIINFDALATSFQTMLAADDLSDMMAMATYYFPTQYGDPIEEGYFANIYDYKDFCPNYIWMATKYDPDDLRFRDSVFFTPDTIKCFWSMMSEGTMSLNVQARGDYLDKLGLDPDEILTMDDQLEMLKLMKSQLGLDYPYCAMNTIDGVRTFICYDTIAQVSTRNTLTFMHHDGVVTGTNMNDNDKELMKKFNSWWEAGVVDPNYGAYSYFDAYASRIYSGECGFASVASNLTPNVEAAIQDPDAYLTPIHLPVLYEGQVFHFNGFNDKNSIGQTVISAKCSNIELVVTWNDWRYSPFGSEYNTWGKEGYIWEYDENGERVITELAINDPMGLSNYIKLYGFDYITEGGFEHMERNYLGETGQRIHAIEQYWMDYEYDAAYDLPKGCTLNAEQQAKYYAFKDDVATYQAETYPLFFTGDKPFDEWDEYVDTLFDLGIQECLDAYQEALDDYFATH